MYHNFFTFFIFWLNNQLLAFFILYISFNSVWKYTGKFMSIFSLYYYFSFILSIFLLDISFSFSFLPSIVYHMFHYIIFILAHLSMFAKVQMLKGKHERNLSVCNKFKILWNFESFLFLLSFSLWRVLTPLTLIILFVDILCMLYFYLIGIDTYGHLEEVWSNLIFYYFNFLFMLFFICLFELRVELYNEKICLTWMTICDER